MKRKHTSKLQKWTEYHQQKPYVLLGVRQAGKTYLLQRFCEKNFREYLYVNFAKTPEYKEAFEDSLDPENIAIQLSFLSGKKIDFETTALFFDEIQECEKAISSLKYFCESRKQYKIVCAGSLLGVAINRFSESYPVGKITHDFLYPLDFEKFLWAIERNDIADMIADCYESNKNMPMVIHKRIIKLYKDYLFTGGMPAAVLEYIRCKGNIVDFDTNIKSDILRAYMYDMNKYTTNSESIKINKLYSSLPRQLNKDNSKFTYALVEKGASKRLYETSIDWLIDSGMVIRCNLVENPEIPLKAYASDSIFKIYMSDVGLLSELSGLTAADFLIDNFKRYNGMLAENFVAQTLASKGYSLYFWRSKRNAELDFLLHKEGKVIPLEVKSSTNKKAQSLRVYVGKYSPEYSIRISGRNFGFANKIKSIPLYAAYLL